MGKVKLSHEIVVNIYLLAAVAGGFVRGMDNDLIYQSMKDGRGQSVRYSIAPHQL